jgi:thiamine-monophosphate kinase
LNGGEDYELLFTVSQADYEKIRNHPDISVIGYMEGPDEVPVLVTKQENMVPLRAQGWDHFTS